MELATQVEQGLKTASLRRRPVVEGTLLVKGDPGAAGATLLEAVQKVREAASRAQSQNNLKQFALAMHNYHSTYNHLPPAASFDKNGKPMLSWRVMILPFIEQDALYKQFRLEEPWDSEHNKKLLAKMPEVFASPDEKSHDLTKPITRCLSARASSLRGRKASASRTSPTASRTRS